MSDPVRVLTPSEQDKVRRAVRAQAGGYQGFGEMMMLVSEDTKMRAPASAGAAKEAVRTADKGQPKTIWMIELILATATEILGKDDPHETIRQLSNERDSLRSQLISAQQRLRGQSDDEAVSILRHVVLHGADESSLLEAARYLLRKENKGG
jgi:hypothetical protein